MRDITDRKQADDVLKARLRLSQFADQHVLDELLLATLDEAEGLTGSRIGFFSFSGSRPENAATASVVNQHC